mmetsp:Transcript_50028/g.116760  ORF Transcript_50028/g.116760 Transcript_50028/m.116760 type:complete len:250 (-) Transcript_50028:145-894(-)
MLAPGFRRLVPSALLRRQAPAWRCFADVGEGDATPEDPGNALVKSGVRVYRRQRAEHWRTFRWGIGSAFRMESINRFTPVHKPHPMGSVVRDDYYESENSNIVWNETREGWEVYWYEHSKLNAKPFPVKKYGLERSKKEAFQFYSELADAGKLGEKPHFPAPEEGVFFDQRLQSWVCFFWRDGRPQSRCYSAMKYGFDGAKTLAVAKRRDPVDGILPVRGGGGTPLIMKEKGPTPQQMKYKGGHIGLKY